LWCKVLIHDNLTDMKSWDGATYYENQIGYI
jgi:hypothetical protein